MLDFDFRLARELGMTVAEMRRRMTMREWVRWRAYFLLENQEAELRRAEAEARAGR